MLQNSQVQNFVFQVVSSDMLGLVLDAGRSQLVAPAKGRYPGKRPTIAIQRGGATTATPTRPERRGCMSMHPRAMAAMPATASSSRSSWLGSDRRLPAPIWAALALARAAQG